MRSFSCPIAPKMCTELSEAVHLKIHLWTDQIGAWQFVTMEWKE